MSKRDYGSFSHACERHFGAIVARMGFLALGGVNFARHHEGWSDGVFLQQSIYGDGKFSMTAGFHVPGLTRLWQTNEHFGLLLGTRVSELGVHHDLWLPASNRVELLDSLRQFGEHLEHILPWFARINSVEALANEYRASHHALHVPADLVASPHELACANYGFLLILAGLETAAIPWLHAAQRLLSQPLYSLPGGRLLTERINGARLVKASREDIARVKAIEDALASIEAGAV
jgi:hypothetical protein